MKVLAVVDRSRNRLQINFSIGGNRFNIKPGLKVDPTKWDHKRQKYKVGHIDEIIQGYLHFFRQLESTALKESQALTKEYVQDKWRAAIGKFPKAPSEKRERSFFEYFEYLPEKYKYQKSENTLSKFKQVSIHLKDFNKDLTFDDIDENFYDEYNDYLITTAKNRQSKQIGFSQNTIAKHWDKIRIVCSEAEKDGIKVNAVYRDFKSKSIRSKPIWLTREEGEMIAKVELTKRMKVIRDEFMARYYTGLRSSDMDMINKNCVFEDRGQMFLKFTHVKTRQSSVIAIHQKAREILEAYDFKFPSITLQEKNRHIKTIAEKAGMKSEVAITKYIGSKRIDEVKPKSEMITTHTARRSFGRRFMESVGDITQLCEIYGQSDTKITIRYIGWEDSELSKSINRIHF
jgi:site-specific recombinase XerD